jgi:hypothetical protein
MRFKRVARARAILHAALLSHHTVSLLCRPHAACRVSAAAAGLEEAMHPTLSASLHVARSRTATAQKCRFPATMERGMMPACVLLPKIRTGERKRAELATPQHQTCPSCSSAQVLACEAAARTARSGSRTRTGALRGVVVPSPRQPFKL